MGGPQPAPGGPAPRFFQVNLRTGRWANFATGDKGGHRVRAIQLINQAEAEVRRGIEWDNTHH